MLIFGHSLIEAKSFYHIAEIESIKHTPSNSYIYLQYSNNIVDIIEHCRENSLEFSLHVESLKEVIFAHHFGAKYIIVNDGIVKLAQKAADDYMFDAKILCTIEHEESIETLATLGVDGVIFPEAIIKIS